MEEKSTHGILKEHMIFQKTHTQSLADVRTLNMWGYELYDVAIIDQMPNVETISLSLNKITTLRPFANCYNLKSLFLRQNLISDLQEVNYLQRLPNLRSLMLRDNPVSELPNYRTYIAQALPQLEKLDDIDIAAGERQGRIVYRPQVQQQPQQYQGDNNNYLSGPQSSRGSKSQMGQNDNNMNMRLSQNRGNSSARGPLDDRRETWQEPREYEKKQNHLKPIEHRPIMQPRPRNGSSSTDDSMLAAVLALIPELSDDSIQIVLDAIRNRRA